MATLNGCITSHTRKKIIHSQAGALQTVPAFFELYYKHNTDYINQVPGIINIIVDE